MRKLVSLPSVLVLALLSALGGSAGCGGGGGSTQSNAPTGENVQPIVVDSGPLNNYINGLFTSVTVCVPGNGSACQTVSGVLVDTGSTGLRILSSSLTLALPQQTDSNGDPIAECAQFSDGFTWGPVQLADITLGGEQATSVPIQVIGDPGFSEIPANCSSNGAPKNTLADLDANGVLGVGSFREDCGSSCAQSGPANPGLYYACPSSGCQQTAVDLSEQVQNPVWLFASDNNGVVIELPSVPATGATSVNGSLVFGIGTRENNALGGATILTLNAQGNFTTIFQGHSYPSSFLDSGSNGLFFLSSATTGIDLCDNNADFYCPSSTENLSATNRGTNGATTTFGFSVANANSLFAHQGHVAFDNLGGPNPGIFDWGLPFFFGRNVFTAIEGQDTPAGPGPYWAY